MYRYNQNHRLRDLTKLVIIIIVYNIRVLKMFKFDVLNDSKKTTYYIYARDVGNTKYNIYFNTYTCTQVRFTT